MHPLCGRICGFGALVALACASLLGIVAAEEPAADSAKLPPPAKVEVDFARDVKPLFAKHCLKCHGPDKQTAGLRLDLHGDAVRGGDSGPAFEAGKSADSLLVKYVAALDPELVMPPEGDKLTRDEVALLRAWIDQGAKWSQDANGEGRADSKHWSFRPVRRPTTPD